MSRVASMLRVASALSCAHSAGVGTPSASSLISSRDAGISTSSMVFSPTSALPRCLMDSTPAAKAWANSVRLGRSLSFSDLAIARKKLEISGPDAPPMVDSSFMPMAFSAPLTDCLARSSCIATSTSQPRRMLR